MAKIQIGKPIGEIVKEWSGLKGRLPGIVGTEAVNHFKKSFRDQGFTDSELELWKARKNQKAKDEGRAILTLTGRLRRAIRILYQSEKRVQVGVDGNEVPYAAAQNNGYTGMVNIKAAMHKNKSGDTYNINTRRVSSKGVRGVKAHTRMMNIPSRKFIGESVALNKKIDDKINRVLKNILG